MCSIQAMMTTKHAFRTPAIHNRAHMDCWIPTRETHTYRTSPDSPRQITKYSKYYTYVDDRDNINTILNTIQYNCTRQQQKWYCMIEHSARVQKSTITYTIETKGSIILNACTAPKSKGRFNTSSIPNMHSNNKSVQTTIFLRPSPTTNIVITPSNR